MTEPMSAPALAERIGAEIRQLRERAGLSMRQLAAEAGISQPFLSQIERGSSAPSMVTTYRLAEALRVLPGALLPAPENTMVTVVRAADGRMLPVANRDDAALGRALIMQSASPLEVIEYLVEPHQHLAEWFQLEAELAVYLISGALDVEVEGVGVWRLGARDLLAHPASLRHRWLLVDDQPAHILLVLAHPSTSAGKAATAGRFTAPT
jgi:transcriptional regulator with XRE-family HTH domain